MSWLDPPDDVVVPRRWRRVPVPAPRVTAADAAAVQVDEDGEPLVPVRLPCRVVYEEMPLPSRGPLRLRAGLLGRLVAAHEALPEPFGLLILDGWRSVDFQRALLDHYRRVTPSLREGFVADPGFGLLPPHTTGGAADLTLSYEGRGLALGTDYDEFDDDARPDALEAAGASAARDLRRMLHRALCGQGLAGHPLEWWHWSYGEQWWAAAEARPSCPYGVVGSRED